MISAFSQYMGIQEQTTASTIKEHKLKDMLSICINLFHFFFFYKNYLKNSQRKIPNKTKYLHAQHQSDILK